MKTLTLRLIVALIVGVTFVSLASSWYDVRTTQSARRAELESKAESLGQGLATEADATLRAGDTARLEMSVRRYPLRDHLLGIGIYGGDGAPLISTPGLARLISGAPKKLMADALASNRVESEFTLLPVKQMHVQVTPIRSDGGKPIGEVVIVHDATYIQAEIIRIWSRFFFHMALQMLVIAVITFLVLRWSFALPIARVAQWIKALRMGRHAVRPSAEDLNLLPFANEVAPMAESMRRARAEAETEARLRNINESLWTAQRLADHVNKKLDGSNLFVVSNREPYTHTRGDKKIDLTVPASGLVTAIEPILRTCHGTWVAYGSGNADRETVDAHARLQVPPDDPRYTLRRIWLSTQEEDGYYNGFANEGLWPLCHIAHTRPIFRTSDWEYYNKVNRRFADALVQEIGHEENPVVLVQDYHFGLLPRMLKERLPHARVAIFWHIPWPNPESFSICPWQRELLDGLLGADLIGFHTQAYCNNFINTVDHVLESKVDWEQFSIERNQHRSSVLPFPISVELVDDRPDPYAVSADEERSNLLQELGIEATFLGVGVDRVDYTKGILERFLAVESFLERYPKYQGKFTFIQIGAPSRTRIKRYADFQSEVEAEAERINARFKRGKWKPIIFRNREHSHQEVQRYYRAAHLCMVTSLHDGMNLVAKEYVAARQDERGVLILSRFTGAARELHDALIVNPYDVEGTAEAVAQALEMDVSEMADRMRRLRRSVRERNIYWWAANLIGELCDLRLKPKRATVSVINRTKAVS